jgi:hypothetical protein
MSDAAVPPRGRPAPTLMLCRHCVEYVFAGTATCPHCGHDPSVASARYRDGGYQALEAINRIDDALRRRRGATAPPSRDRSH